MINSSSFQPVCAHEQAMNGAALELPGNRAEVLVGA
jgi:hypothetical protein